MAKVQLIKLISDQLITKGNTEIIDLAFSKDYCAHAGNKAYRGKSFIKRYAREIRNAIHHLKVEQIEVLSLSKDKISWLRKLSGTHKMALRGIPASDKKVLWYEMVVSRFENSKIAEEWVISELAGQLLLKNK